MGPLSGLRFNTAALNYYILRRIRELQDSGNYSLKGAILEVRKEVSEIRGSGQS